MTSIILAEDTKSADFPTSGCCSNRWTFAQSFDPATFAQPDAPITPISP